MKIRLPYYELSKDVLEKYKSLFESLENSSLELELLELVYLRVSQINGCAFCFKKHADILRKNDVPQSKLDAIAGWDITNAFDEKEKSAFAWADSLTHISTTHAPDELFENLKKHFSDKEISDLTFAISSMNAMNRIIISVRQ